MNLNIIKRLNLGRNAKCIFLTVLISIFTQNLCAQNFDKNSPYQLVYDKSNNDIYLSVNFIDTETKRILNTFDLVENNPFNKLDYPELKQNKFNQPNKSYNLDGISLDKIKVPVEKLVLKNNFDQTIPKNELVGWSFYQASISGEYLVVNYSFNVHWGDMVLGRSDAVFIFNNQGEQLHKLEGFDTNVREWGLTKNGRYFSYAYGSALDESLSSFSSVGYKVIDLEENKIMFQEDFGHKFNEVRTSSWNNMIVATGFSVDYYYIFLDLTKKVKYTRVFTNKELGLWKELTDKGVIIYNGKRNSDSFKLLKFDTDFEVIEIN